jgi:hypothetical protein
MTGLMKAGIVSQYVFMAIGALVVFAAGRWFYYAAQINAFERGAKVPLKFGLIIFLIIFAAIKVFGYELDMGIAIIYFGLMLAWVFGIMRGRLLARNYKRS